MKQLLIDDSGAATAEYAIATLAAVGLAGLLVVILKSDEIRQMVLDLIKNALTPPAAA
jgi:Flp pilus assembly pilin Flp